MFHLGKYFKRIGPGVITGASDDDPSGIVTYSQTGARYGYGLLWLALFTTPLMMAVQELSGRLGLVTRRGLAALIRRHYSRRAAMIIAASLLIANIVNIGADLSAMAAVMKLLIPGPVVVYIIGFAALIIILEVFVSYARYANILKWLTLSLLTYVVAAFVTKQDWLAVMVSTLVPTIPRDGTVWLLITGILGTTITPYCFFWEASEEVEEGNMLAKLKRKIIPSIKDRLRILRLDTAAGMIYSNVVMFFIIVTTAGVLHTAGVTNITTAQQAAEALRPLAGNFAFALFALGIIGIGLLAVPILAGSAAYALAEVFNWPEGLGKKFREAKAFYITIVAAILVGAIITASGLSPVTFLLVAAVVNGLVAPAIIWFMLKLANRPDVALMMVIQFIWK
jgi:NRAMP (natural resistance-associated macrophage protein)-like metal ion transporter